tara:strand:- start:175 stop:396 length:222 start_codon:yes stop_codon:yes gene_type:complete
MTYNEFDERKKRINKKIQKDDFSDSIGEPIFQMFRGILKTILALVGGVLYWFLGIIIIMLVFGALGMIIDLFS